MYKADRYAKTIDTWDESPCSFVRLTSDSSFNRGPIKEKGQKYVRRNFWIFAPFPFVRIFKSTQPPLLVSMFAFGHSSLLTNSAYKLAGCHAPSSQSLRCASINKWIAAASSSQPSRLFLSLATYTVHTVLRIWRRKEGKKGQRWCSTFRWDTIYDVCKMLSMLSVTHQLARGTLDLIKKCNLH